MQEIRKHERVHLTHYLMIFDRTTDKFLGMLVNVSRGGFMLIGESPLESYPDKDSVLQLRMDFPKELSGATCLEFDAKIVYWKTDVNPDLVAVGYKLQNITEEDLKVLGELIDFYRDTDQED